MIRPAFSIIALFLCATPLFSQPWMEPLTEGGGRNFYDIQRSFNEYWEGKDTRQKGKGWKQFKRWEWFWEQRVFPTGEFPDPMHLYNESMKAAIRRGTAADSGGNWIGLGPADSPGGYSGLGRLNCVRVDPSNVNVIWVGAASGGLWKSTDGGTTWNTNTDKLPTLGVTDIVFDPLNPSIMYLATGDGDAGDTYSIGVIKSTDGGATWNTTGLNWSTSLTRRISRLLIHPDNPDILVAAGSNIHRTTDAGATWTQVQGGTYRDAEFKPGNPDIVYASGTGGQVVRSTNGGVSWHSLSGGLPGGGGRVALAVTPANPEYLYALYATSGSSGFQGLYRSENSGETWILKSNSPNLLGWSVTGDDNGGQGWYDLAIAASPLNADEIYVGGVNNWKSTNGGSTWLIVSMWYSGTGVPAVHADQHDLWFVPGTNTLYSGNDGGIYRTTDGGSTWAWLGRGLKITQFYRFGNSATNPDVLIAGSQDNGTKSLGGGTWRDVLGGDGMECLVDHINPNIMYGSLYYGDIYKSVNGGFSFFPCTGGITENGAWVTPYVMDPVDNNTLYAGFTNVWKTEDGASSWERISSFGGGTLSIVEVSPSNPAVIYAGRSNTLFRTDNGGAGFQWQTLTTPTGAGTLTYLTIHPTNPYRIWVTSSGYSSGNKVYESTNGGVTWMNISGTLPNIPVNCITYQKNSPDRLYIGTDIGVYYRDLITTDWTDFNTGLPNVIVNELEVVYSAGKLRAATYGRGVWESDLLPDQGAVLGPSPSFVDFGLREVGVPGTAIEVTLTNYGTDTLEIKHIQEFSPVLSLSNLPAMPVTLASSQSVSFLVAFAPEAHGTITDSVLITSNAMNGPVTKIAVTGKGIVIGQAQTGTMYAVSGPPTSTLYTVDIFSGSLTEVGPLGVPEIQGLAIHPETKALHGVAPAPGGTQVFKISALYGDALPTALIPLSNMRAFSLSGTTAAFGATNTGRLYRIDLSSGDTVFIGSASGIVYASLSISPASGEMWASVRPPITNRDRIYKVNTTKGSVSLVGTTGDNAITPAITFGTAGKLYGLKGSGGQTNTLIRIDTSTAAGTVVGSMGMQGIQAIVMRVDSIVSSVGDETTDGIPREFILRQNYPNPFNPGTVIVYGLPEQSRVTVRVFNLVGQEIASLADDIQDAGYHTVRWDGATTGGSLAASGLYFYRIEAAAGQSTFVATRKMLLLR